MKLKMKFKLEKKTTNTIRYQEVDNTGEPADSPLVRTLYVQKSALGENVPKKLRVTIRSA